MIDDFKCLQYPSREITKEQFLAWRHSDCFKELKRDMVQAIAESVATAFPSTFDETVIQSQRRQGALELIEDVLNWTPLSLRSADIDLEGDE